MTNTTTTNNKGAKISFWVSTGLLALFILPGIFFINSPMAKEGNAHMGIPNWLAMEVGIGHFIGALILIIPLFGKRIKEWSYVALGIEYISATIGHIAIDGFTGASFFPLVIFIILLVSYMSYHKLKD